MKEFLNEKMLLEIFNALEKGETFNYSDDNAQISISPNSMSIQLKTEHSNKDDEIKEFLDFCEKIDDRLFIDVCESFDNLEELQMQLDTENYKEVIKVFTQRVKEIADNKLTKIVNEARVELERQEQIIESAQKAIEDINKQIDEAYACYTI